MEIYLLRHAETVWNLEERLQGWKNSPLTSKGEEAARLQAMKLREISFEMAFSSDLGRAVDSLDILLEGRKIPVCYTDKLRELALGPWEGKTFQEVKDQYPEQVKRYFEAPQLHRIEGVEDYYDLQERIQSFLQDLKDLPYKKILVVAHGVSIQAILNEIEGLGLEDFWKKPLVRGMDISRISYGPGGYKLISRARKIEGRSY